MGDILFEFTIPTESLSVFARRLAALTKIDKTSVLTFFVEKDGGVRVLFRSHIDTLGTEAAFEYFLPQADVKIQGVVSVFSHEISDIISRFPSFTKTNKPHSKELVFQATVSSLKIKTTMFWNETSKPTKQEITVNTLRSSDNITSPFVNLELKKNLVTTKTDDFKEAIDMSCFIKGDITSKNEYGYFIFGEDGKIVIISTDLIMASRYVLLGEGDIESLNGVLSRDVLNMVRSFIDMSETVSFTMYNNLLYVETLNRKMLAPLMKTQYIIQSDLFFQPALSLGKVGVNSLNYVLSHFVTVSKDPYHKTTFDFNKEGNKFRVFSGEQKENNVDSLPATVAANNSFDVDASYFNAILRRLQKLGEECNISVDTETGERIKLESENDEVIYLIQGINHSNAA